MFSLTHEEIKLYVICLGLSLVFVLLSVIFFFIFSPKKTTPKYILFFSLLLGIFAGISAFLIEWLALNLFNFNFYSLKFGFSPEHWTDLIGPILFAFLFAALIEESIKFFILKKIINVSSVNQIIDGLKIGLIAGLGFALIENMIYFTDFYSQFNQINFVLTVFLRGVIATLAHGLYGMIMSYYLTLGKFNVLRQNYFYRKGFFTALTIHGLFNFFLIINLGFYSITLLSLFLIITLIWLNQRKNLELHISRYGKDFTLPIFAEKPEIEAVLMKQKSPVEFFQKLNELFPDEEKPDSFFERLTEIDLKKRRKK